MPPKSQSSQPKPSTQKKIKPTRVNLAKLDAPSHSTKRINPLTAFKSSSQSLPSQRDRDGDTLLLSQGTVNGKQVQSGGKGKEKARLTLSPLEDIEDRLWVDIYEPTTEAELAVHVRKVEDVRRWLVEAFDGGPSGKLKKYRVCRLPVHQCRHLILLEDPRPDGTSWHRKNIHYSRSRS